MKSSVHLTSASQHGIMDTTSHAFQQPQDALPASSSPTANVEDRATPSSSPPSPSWGRVLPGTRRLPSQRNSSGSTWDRSTSLSSDPFGASFGAPSSSHPAFSRDAPHTSPKLRSRKRAAPPSPASVSGGGAPSAVMRSLSPSTGIKRIPSTADVLARHFDSSSSDGGAPSSDDVLEAYPWSAVPSSSSLVDANGVTGLGLQGNLYAEPLSPTNRKSFAARTFDRTTSGTDPLAAAWTESASPRRPPQQRRRIQGPSPHQSTTRQTARTTAPQQHQTLSGLLGGESEDDGDWSKIVPPSRDGFWRKLIDDVFQKVDPKVVLSDRKLSSISPMIADLSKFVALDDSRSFSSSADTLMRTSSSATSGLGGGRAFSRATSSAMSSVLGPAPDSPARMADNVHGKLQFHFDGNNLTKLPSALFDVHALTFLTLRKNNLKTLPAAIGELCNLLDLNVCSNELTYLPAEIQRLSLARFTYFPNPFLKPPSGERLQVRPFFSTLSRSAASPSLHDRLQSTSSPSSSSQPSGLMGPPALPSRLRAASRSFARTASDAEVSELLARGTEAMGTPLGARQRYLGASLLSGSTSFAHASDDEDSEMKLDTVASPFAQSFSDRSPPPPPPPIQGVARFLGPLHLMQGGHAMGTHAPGLPTLRESCIRRILGPSDEVKDTEMAGSSTRARANEARQSCAGGAATNKPLLLDGYETGLLRELRGDLPTTDVRTLEAARRSANGAWGVPSYTNASNQSGRTWCSGSQSAQLSTRELERSAKHVEARRAGLDTAWGSDEEARGDADRSASASPKSEESDDVTKHPTPIRQAMNVEEELDQGDDAAVNPWFSRCPNPLHSRRDRGRLPSVLAPINDTPTCDWPLGISVDATHAAPLFAAEAARQVEWVSHIASCRVAKSGIATTLIGPLHPPSASANTNTDTNTPTATDAEADRSQAVVADVIPASAKSEESQLLPILWRGCSRRCLDFLNSV